MSKMLSINKHCLQHFSAVNPKINNAAYRRTKHSLLVRESSFSFSDFNVFQLQKSIASEVNNAEVLRPNPEVNGQLILEECQSYIEIIGGTLT